jgi:hypothetical protein
MTQPPSHPLGLHCLLYLSADQICPPVRDRPGGFAIEYHPSKRPWFVQLLDGWQAVIYIRTPWVTEKRVSVPCRPTVKVSPDELGSRLLMAALLDCRDAGQLQLRLSDNRDWRPGIIDPEPSRVWVTPLTSASGPGLCGRILETLERQGEQSAKKLLTDMMGDFSEEWVIYQVEAELAALGYMRPQATPRWRPTPEVQRFVGDCEQLRTLEQERAQAVDRWRQVIDADQQLCDALLADCTDSITPPPTGRVKEWRITGPA